MTHKEFFIKILHILKRHNIEYAIFCGTLLGAVRDKNFLPSDFKDTDIVIKEEDYSKVREVFDKLILQKQYIYGSIWRKELNITSLDNKYKVDIFIVEKIQEDAYIYSYKENDKDKKWNYEWRAKFNYSDIFPSKLDDFLGEYVSFPANPEKILETHFGNDWTIPNPKFPSQEPLNKDKGYIGFYPAGINSPNIKNHFDFSTDNLTAIITTTERDINLKILLTSIQIYYPNLSILVGYQGEKTLDIDFGKNVKIYSFPEDCGLSYLRNELVKNVKTKYTLILEDDFIFNETTILKNLVEVFEVDKNIGIVGGQLLENNELRTYERFLLPSGKLLLGMTWNQAYQLKICSYNNYKNIKYGYADMIFNFFIAKTDILLKYPWNIEHKIHSEHLDFFINLKMNSNIKISFIPNLTITHNHTDNNKFKVIRNRQYYNYIYEKYSFEKGYTFGESCFMNYKDNKREKLF